jgi:hypothetical protein
MVFGPFTLAARDALMVGFGLDIGHGRKGLQNGHKRNTYLVHLDMDIKGRL